MLPGMELMGCQDLAVPRDVMHHVVRVESSFNPYAIGVVDGRLARQPRNLPEAISTARMLEQRGYNFSLGLAQVNRHYGALYVLLQSDTHAARTRSQTLLSVAKLDIRGQVQATRTVYVPEGFGQACSAWVDEQPAHFRWEDGRLIIEGYYRPMSDISAGKPFRTSLGPELDP